MKKIAFTIAALSLILAGCVNQNANTNQTPAASNNITNTATSSETQTLNNVNSGDGHKTETEQQQQVSEAGMGNINSFDLNIKSGDNLASPVTVKGETDLNIDSFIIELQNDNGKALVQEKVNVRKGDSINTFEITLNFEFNNTKEGYLVCYKEDDSYEGRNLYSIPVKFNQAVQTDEQVSEVWRTYKNEKFGFELRYPESYNYFGETDNLVQIGLNKNDIHRTPMNTITIIDKGSQASIKELVDAIKTRDAMTTVVDEREVAINGISMSKIAVTAAIGYDDVHYFFQKDGSIFEIKAEEGNKLQKEIISTFKFTN